MCVCVCAHKSGTPSEGSVRCTSSPPNSLPTAQSCAGSPPHSFVRAGAGGSQVVKGYKIQAWQLPHVVICLCLILLNIAEVFILLFLSQALFFLTKAKVGFFNERRFSFGFWEMGFLVCFTYFWWEKIKINSVAIWKSSFVRTCLLWWKRIHNCWKINCTAANLAMIVCKGGHAVHSLGYIYL